MLDLFLSAFVTLFVVIDPPGCAPIYAGLVGDASHRQAITMALRACIIATLILKKTGAAAAVFWKTLFRPLPVQLKR